MNRRRVSINSIGEVTVEPRLWRTETKEARELDGGNRWAINWLSPGFEEWSKTTLLPKEILNIRSVWGVQDFLNDERSRFWYNSRFPPGLFVETEFFIPGISGKRMSINRGLIETVALELGGSVQTYDQDRNGLHIGLLVPIEDRHCCQSTKNLLHTATERFWKRWGAPVWG